MISFWHTNTFRQPEARMIHVDIPAQEAKELAACIEYVAGALALYDALVEPNIDRDYYKRILGARTKLDLFGKQLGAEVTKKR